MNVICTVVCIGPMWCYTVGEFREHLAGIELVRHPAYLRSPRDFDCLCGVDVDATLTAAGIQYEKDDLGDYHLVSDCRVGTEV